MKFYDREREIARLRSFGEGPFILAVVGRRRVGKTRLITEAFPGCIYLFVSEEKSERMLCEEWRRNLQEELYIPEFSDADRFIEYLINTTQRVIFIDEVQNLERINPAVLSRLQRVLDATREQAKVVFCGSYVSMVNRLFTSSGSPLFGRADVVLHLRELDFATVSEILRDMGFSFNDTVTLYSVFGGMPRYYELMERTGAREVKSIVSEMFFDEFSPLRHEGSLVLRNEFGGEYRVYFSIMEAIASGKSTLTEISDSVGMKAQTLSKYLVSLREDFGLIERRTPVTDEARRSRSGRYFLKNNFYAFWFRFVHRNYSFLEEGKYERVFERTMELLPDHTGRIFEGIVRDNLRRTDEWDRVGQWWNRKGDEIDIVALNEKRKEILFGEVKWRNRPVGWNVVEELMKKKELVNWHNGERKERFLVVSKSGFTKKCIERMDEEGVMHWDIEEVAGILTGESR